ncbi:MAG: tyrosine-type recombinase/integrase [Halarcobacter ebronensis]|uniref:tyrosine-type recombinase/integrase n=1 Tax=Halarcobacter ebronensis TaxID=1462615 RepID=UPI003C725933
MGKYVNIKILNKDCKGIYLFTNADIKIITDPKEATKILTNPFKLQLRTKVGNKTGKKTFEFNKKKTTFLSALEEVASQRQIIKDILIKEGTLRPKKIAIEESKKAETFLEVANRYIETKSISARPSTIQNYKTALLTHCSALHDLSIDDITVDNVQNIINEQMQTKAPATVSLLCVTIKTFAKKVGLNLDGLELPEFDNKVECTLSLEDTKRIIKAMREYSRLPIEGEAVYQYPEIRNIFAFLLTGRRISEVLGLRYSDINFETNVFKIPSSRAKGKKDLVYNLDSYLLDAIKRQASATGVTDMTIDKRIFTYTKETPRIHFQSLLEALGIKKLRLHDIRHMLGSTLVQHGVPIADISVMLGHSSIAITEERYANKTKDQATRATNALNELISN